MRKSIVLVAALTGALSALACDTQPADLNPRFQWQEAVPELTDALLGGCAFGNVSYAVGGLAEEGALYRYTGRRWIQEATNVVGSRLWDCWAGPNNLVFAVGDNGTIFHHTAEGWHRDPVPSSVAEASLYGVWGMADGTVVAVGGGLSDSTETAVILHYDGESWQRANASNIDTKNLRAIWGSSPDNYFAVGDDGTIARFDGEEWKPSNSKVNDRLYGIHGNGPGEIYAVGGTGRGVVLRWNGSSWVPFHEPSGSLRTIWTSPGNHLYIAGDDGFVARYDRFGDLPSAATVVSATPFPHLRIHALVGVGNGIFGSAGTMLTGENGDWSGAVVSHLRSFSGPVFESSAPDADLPDAGVADADVADAVVADAGE
jgi:hypothetical protein